MSVVGESKLQTFLLPLRRYDNRKNTGNEGADRRSKEVSLTLTTDGRK